MKHRQNNIALVHALSKCVGRKEFLTVCESRGNSLADNLADLVCSGRGSRDVRMAMSAAAAGWHKAQCPRVRQIM